MKQASRMPRRTYLLLALVALAALALSALPAPTAQAAKVPKPLDNTLDEFNSGTFQLTGLTGTAHADIDPSDVDGAVLLMRQGKIRSWTEVSYDLPKPLTEHAVVSLGPWIYVIGGTNGETQERVSDVLFTRVDLTTGVPAHPTDPASQSVWKATASLALARTAAAAVAVPTDSNGNGYIYVIGGSIRSGQFDVGDTVVYVGQVNGTTGEVTWSEGPALPKALQGAEAVVITNASGTYLYVLGGLSRRLGPTGVLENPSATVYYAKVNLGNGALTKPSAPSEAGWDPQANKIGGFDETAGEGLWRATAVAGHFDGADESEDIIFLIGGQKTLDFEYNSVVWQAFVEEDGSLSNWYEAGTMSPRIDLAGVTFGGKFYVTGGAPSAQDQPNDDILNSYLDSGFVLHDFGSGASFLITADGLPFPRANHAMTVVKSSGVDDDNIAAAFVYVIGGRGDRTDLNTTDDEGSRSVIFGEIGGAETEDGPYAPEGWFYGKPRDIRVGGLQAEVEEISWGAFRPNDGTDIKIEYRVGRSSSDCESPNAFKDSQGNEVPWVQDVDGDPDSAAYSKTGVNRVVLPDMAAANCFQYRAKLTTSGANAETSPELLNVSIVVIIPGGPNIQVSQLKDKRTESGSFSGLQIEIWNHNNTPDQVTLPALDVFSNEPNGTFFVDLLIYGPAASAPTPPDPLTVPLDSATLQASKGYTHVWKSEMSPDAKKTITSFCDPANEQSCDQFSLNDPNVLRELFPAPGWYTVVVVVDSYQCSGKDFPGCVDEREANGESDNYRTLSFEIKPKPGSDPNNPEPDIATGVMLPMTKRSP